MTDSPWKTLYDSQILFTLRGEAAVLFGHSADALASERLLAARGLSAERAASLAARIEPSWFPSGAVIDIAFLSDRLAETGGDPGAEGLRALAFLSRIKLQGTDGLRGRTRDEELSYREALGLFLREGVVTPGFFALSAEALGRECLEQGMVDPGAEVVVGADGRDTTGRFTGAVIAGFGGLGFQVLDAGVIATPGVPLYARYAKCRLGAIVTASHNPANQNGIKYIHDGFKLANDGPAGEYGLTAFMYGLADRGGAAPRGVSAAHDAHEEATELLCRVDLENAGLEPGRLEGLRIVYDGANGAYSRLACRVLAALGADYVAVNVEPQGHNINQGGGVGEIEGHAFFEASPSTGLPASSLKTVRAMFEEGRGAAPGKRVFGIVNDGDGDRGYLLVYLPRDDRVYVVPGDELAFWLARGRKAAGDLGERPVCVNSVESDILAGHYMETLLGLESETACVGDKNLLKPAREGRNHIVGCEESGHVTFGVSVEDRGGGRGMVYTGNGLLSVLRAISVIQGSGASPEEAIHPFPAGRKDCRYVYFVDKARFFRGSPVWRRDEEAAAAAIRGRLPAAYSLRRVDFPDDPEMLYLACFNPGGLKEASLFVRNSGTELKSCVTLRSTEALYPAMEAAMLAVHELNRVLMKDEALRDARAEAQILALLGPGELRPETLKEGVESRLGERLADTDFQAILFAMRKEGLIVDSGEALTLSRRSPCS
jgi:phosphoglucosamine mutase